MEESTKKTAKATKQSTTAKNGAQKPARTKTAAAKQTASNKQTVTQKQTADKKSTTNKKQTNTSKQASVEVSQTSQSKKTASKNKAERPQPATSTSKQTKTAKKSTTKAATAAKPNKKTTDAKISTKNRKKVASSSTQTTSKSAQKQTEADEQIAQMQADHSGTETWVDGFHGLKLYTLLYDKVERPKAVVLIVHGMQEHCRRYDDFAQFLNTKGYIVVTSDLRGHGRTMQTKDDYGRGESDIFTECVKDQLAILQQIRATWPLPIYLFGHSFGSFVSQSLIQQSSDIEKAVLCGTTNGSCLLFKMGSVLLSLMKPFERTDKRGGLAEKLCIKSFGKKFERGNWLSRNEAVLDKYVADEFCGGSFPFSFYYSMIKNMTKLNRGVEKVGAKKLLLIAGTSDPVGQNGKQVKKLHKLFLKANIDAKIKLYENARHELLNETNRQEVFEDVVNFFDN